MAGCVDRQEGIADCSTGLFCDEIAFSEGRAPSLGVHASDTFIRAVFDLTSAADRSAVELQTELRTLQAIVDVDPNLGDLRGRLDAKLAPWIEEDIAFTAAPIRCTDSLDAAALAAVSCDVELTSTSVVVACAGTCTIDAASQAGCTALTCRGLAPELQCDGMCASGCTHAAPAACDGVCIGECDGAAFEGVCAGMCVGTCELRAGARCAGLCTGKCEFEPPGGACDPVAEPRCDGRVDAAMVCTGGCEGPAVVNPISEECAATIAAMVATARWCEPPKIAALYTRKAGLDSAETAAFHAFLGEFERHLAALLAARVHAKALVRAADDLRGPGADALEVLLAALTTDGDFSSRVMAACAIKVLGGARDRIDASVSVLSKRLNSVESALADLEL